MSGTMFDGDGDKIRAFPFRAIPEPGGLTDYVELSGCNGILIEAVKKLYEVPNKPENPIEWLRLYFKYLAEDVASGAPPPSEGSRDSDSDFTRDMDEVEQMLKLELSEIQSEIISCFEEEAQNKAIIERLENELKNVTMGLSRDHCHDDFVKYLEHGDDYHYRIRPDPMYQASKTDMLLDEAALNNRGVQGTYGRGGGGGFGGGAPLKQDDSFVELVPFDSSLWLAAASHHGNGPGHARLALSREEENKLYADYPQLYFPDRQKQVEVKEPEENVEGDEDEVEEEEDAVNEEASEIMSESDAGVREIKGNLSNPRAEKGKRTAGGVGEGSEYDGGSEGGESDQSRARPPSKKEKSPYTPRNAHDRKHNRDKDTKDRQSQKSHHKATSDKNV